MILSVEFSLYNPVACSKEHHFLRGIGLIHGQRVLGFLNSALTQAPGGSKDFS